MRIRLPWVLALAGVASAAAAIAVRPEFAEASALQDYPAFALVAGLLLVGLVADDEGLFAAAGRWLARLTPHGLPLYAGAALLIGLVTATLNLDTSVAFLTPVLVYTARARGGGESAFVFGALMLSNAGSLLLPGANLTNLIVLGELRLGGADFIARMWLPALAALVVTAIVVAVFERAALRAPAPDSAAPDIGETVAEAGRSGLSRPASAQLLALAAVGAAVVLVVALPDPALPVLALGVTVAGLHLARRQTSPGGVAEVLGVPVLLGLFGIAVALGALGRAWSGPAMLIARLDSIGTAALASAASIAVNNLPAASLMAARGVPHPFSLLVGLNLGPNLCVTGSLAWLLWLKSARRAGAAPSLARASLIGAVAVPASMAAALLCLMVTVP